MKNSGIDQVRVIRHGMKLPLENFPIEIFEIFRVKSINRIDVAFTK